MLPPKDIGCHRTGFQKTCFECVTQHNCRLWTHIIGMDPNTGQEVNAYGCADEFRNKLIIENTQQARQAGASADKVASEVLMLHMSVAEMNNLPPPGANDFLLIEGNDAARPK